MEPDTDQVASPNPLYVVFVDISDADLDQPLVVGHAGQGIFDEEVVPALPALWYCLHLPKTRFETLDMPLEAVSAATRDGEGRSHRVFLAPTSFLEHVDLLRGIVGEFDLALLIAPDGLIDRARAVSRELDATLGATNYSALNQSSLDEHWRALSEHWALGWPPGTRLDARPLVLGPISREGSDLPLRRLRRLMGAVPEATVSGDNAADGALKVLYARTVLESLIELERRGTEPEQVDQELPAVRREVARGIRTKLSLAVPGTSPTYQRLVGPSPQQGAAEDLQDDFPDVLSIMVNHHASAEDSMGIQMRQRVPDAAFHALSALERHWVEGARPTSEGRLRDRLDATMSGFWSEELLTALRSASHIDAFTNFPIGLLRPPGHSAPLAASVRISYRPINPLTRALQRQLVPFDGVSLATGLRVLVAECIPSSDPVGAASRRGWRATGELLEREAGASTTFAIEETLDPARFREAVVQHQPNLLVVSAHGFHTPASNLAGIMLGSTPVMGPELGPMPPIVLLSACHTGPRGGGVVSIADLILALGAQAVLSTLVPVDVFHNSMLMSRFFLYLSLAIRGEEPEETLLDVWHRVQSNSVIMDIAHGHPNLLEWCFRRVEGVSPLEEFMNRRSRGRIRTTHLYEDAEQVLIEIAADRGEEARLRAWLRSPGYLPEAMMYTFIGDPGKMRLRR